MSSKVLEQQSNLSALWYWDKVMMEKIFIAVTLSSEEKVNPTICGMRVTILGTYRVQRLGIFPFVVISLVYSQN